LLYSRGVRDRIKRLIGRLTLSCFILVFFRLKIVQRVYAHSCFSGEGTWKKALPVKVVNRYAISPLRYPKIRQKPKQSGSRFCVVPKGNGAKVVVTLIYNPYADKADCHTVHLGANELVNTLDTELQKRANDDGLTTADFRPAFIGHAAGDSDHYTFGTQCYAVRALWDLKPSWLPLKSSLAADFDPHPNDKGTTAMANTILEALK